MPEYTLEQLREEGPPFAMALLLKCLTEGRPFVTYQDIRAELEYQFEVETIFPPQIGNVAGSLMNQILEIAPDAPLINALITRSNGIPGDGVGGYFAERYDNRRYLDWDNLSTDERVELIQDERIRVYRYPNWGVIARDLFGDMGSLNLRPVDEAETEEDGSHHQYGGVAESEDHKKLKQWVAENPKSLGLRKAFGQGRQEARLPSGDTADVMFVDGNHFVMVEVKSWRSSDEDLKRGIYQCVKYQAVKEAEHLPHETIVQSMLVTERELPVDLKERARLLEIKHKVVEVNGL